MSNNRTLKQTGMFLIATGLIAGVTIVASGQSSSRATSAGQRWLGLMNTDHDDTVDKPEFTKYMLEQFDKADTDHDGTLDAAELAQLKKSLMK
jgi:hypothetical protein